MSEWLTVRHQVAIAGLVRDAQTSRAVSGATVQLTFAPGEFTDWLAAFAKQYGRHWVELAERPDQTQTGVDGHFSFLDLPNGAYTLTTSLPQLGKRCGTVQAQANVARNAQGKITMATVTMQMPATTLKGKITRPDTAPIVMAQVRVKNSDEATLSDSQGNYLLTYLESGDRTVVVSASGFQSVSRNVTLAQGAVTTLDIGLTPTA